MTREHLIWPSDDIAAQAAYWWTILQRNAPCPTQEKACQLWLEESPDHVDAYQTICANYEAVLDLHDDPAFLSQRRLALRPQRSLFEKITIKLMGENLTFPQWQPKWLLLGLPIVGLGAGVFALQFAPIGAISPAQVNARIDTLPAPATRDYRTATGERSTIELEDSSGLELSTETQVQVRMTRNQRALVLHKGQALFDVAKDPNRPFVVYAAGHQIAAIGTKFEVRVEGNDVRVTLFEGKLRVIEPAGLGSTPASRQPKIVSIMPQQRYDSADGVLETLTIEQSQRLLSWRSGRLDFESDALGDVVYEINRYSTQKIKLVDPSLHHLLISGSFKVGSAQRFAEALTIAYPITTVASDNANEILLTKLDE